MPNTPFFTPTTKPNPRRTGKAVDVAARCFVYELFDATGGHTGAWKALRENGQTQATVARAVERGWAILRDDGKGKNKVRTASLTDEGRRPGRRSLRESTNASLLWTAIGGTVGGPT
jgi:hypothetical protein